MNGVVEVGEGKRWDGRQRERNRIGSRGTTNWGGRGGGGGRRRAGSACALVVVTTADVGEGRNAE